MELSQVAKVPSHLTARRILTPQEELGLATIMTYPFTKIQERLHKEGRIPNDLLDQAIAEFRKFLALALLGYRDLGMISPEVDEVWHTFILFTRDYTAFCNEVFGRFLHHDPATSLTPLSPEAGANFVRTYQEVFGDLPPIWGTAGQDKSAVAVETVQQIIGRALTDAAFRAELFSNSDQALAEYALSEADRFVLAGLGREQIEELARELPGAVP